MAIKMHDPNSNTTRNVAKGSNMHQRYLDRGYTETPRPQTTPTPPPPTGGMPGPINSPSTVPTLRNYYGNEIDINLARQAGVRGNFVNTEGQSNIDFSPGGILLGGLQAQGGIGGGQADHLKRIGGDHRDDTARLLQQHAVQQGIEDRSRAEIQNQIDRQSQSINQGLAQSLQANQLAVEQNKQYMEEQLEKLRQQQAVDQNRATNLQNRRGGFYSGGLDYNLGQINASANQGRENLQRDVAARNADIWNRNALLAQQAADQITMLQNQAPDQIRQLINREIDRQRQFEINEAGITGEYQGRPTQEAQHNQWNRDYMDSQFDWQRETDQRDFDWTRETDQRDFDQRVSEREWDQQHAQDKFDWTRETDQRDFDQRVRELEQERQYRQERDSVADRQWLAEYERAGQQFAEQMGLNWAQLGQREREMIMNEAYRRDQFDADQTWRQKDFDQAASNDQFIRGLEIWNTTGRAPDSLKEFGINVEALNNQATSAEVMGLYDDLASEKYTPEEALARIEVAENSGGIDAALAKVFRDTVYAIDPRLDPKVIAEREAAKSGKTSTRIQAGKELLTPQFDIFTADGWRNRLDQLRRLVTGNASSNFQADQEGVD